MSVGIYTELINFEDYYRENVIDEEVLWVNSLDYYSDSDRQLLRDSLFTTLKSNDIKITPTCRCGNLEVAYLRGLKCELCDTIVDARYGDLKPLVWLRQMDNSTPFVSPYFVSLITTLMGNKSSKLFRWFGDATYDAHLSDQDKIKDDILYSAIAQIPSFKRSYSWLLENLEKVLLTVLKVKQYDKQKSRRFQYVIHLWNTERDNILTSILPVVHKSLIVVEVSTKGSFVKASRGDITNAVETFMRYVDSDKQVYRDRATAITVQLLSDMYMKITTDFLSGKEKLIRKNFMGARLHFSMRQVITPINGKHSYNEVYLPWQSAIVTLRPYIINKLTKQGLSYKEINKILFRAVMRYDKRIDDIFKELISKSDGGLPVMVHRNPSQNSASIHVLLATRVKTDVEDKTISLSIMTWVLANGDIDGDEGNLTLLLDKKLYNLMEQLKPEYDVFSTASKYGEIFGKIAIPETAAATLINRVHHEKIEHIKDYL